MDNAFELPTGLGLQLQMSSTGVIAPGIHAGVKMEVAKVRLSSPLIPRVVVFLQGVFLAQSANVFPVQDEVPCQCSHLIRLDEKLKGSTRTHHLAHSSGAWQSRENSAIL